MNNRSPTQQPWNDRKFTIQTTALGGNPSWGPSLYFAYDLQKHCKNTFCPKLRRGTPWQNPQVILYYKETLRTLSPQWIAMSAIQSRIWAIPFLPSHVAWQDMGCIIATKHRESGWSASHNSKFFSPLINMSHPKAGEHFFKGTSFSLSVPSFQLLKMDKKRDMTWRLGSERTTPFD